MFLAFQYVSSFTPSKRLMYSKHLHYMPLILLFCKTQNDSSLPFSNLFVFILLLPFVSLLIALLGISMRVYHLVIFYKAVTFIYSLCHRYSLNVKGLNRLGNLPSIFILYRYVSLFLYIPHFFNI